MKALVGSSDSNVAHGGLIIPNLEFLTHPRYDSNIGIANDIALIFLNEFELAFGRKIGAAYITAASCNRTLPSRTTVSVAGFINNNGFYSLVSAKIFTTDQKVCIGQYKNHTDVVLPEHTMCAYSNTNEFQKLCQSDTGGSYKIYFFFIILTKLIKKFK